MLEQASVAFAIGLFAGASVAAGVVMTLRFGSNWLSGFALEVAGLLWRLAIAGCFVALALWGLEHC